MPLLNVNVENQKTTVSDMRKELARILSKLPGDSDVAFNFRATLKNYKPALKS